MKQTHTVNIVFPGNFAELLEVLEKKGVKMEFNPPGLNGSQSVLEIFPSAEENDFMKELRDL